MWRGVFVVVEGIEGCGRASNERGELINFVQEGATLQNGSSQSAGENQMLSACVWQPCMKTRVIHTLCGGLYL